MRKLLLMGIGFCAACLLGAYALSTLWLLVLGAALLCAAAALLLVFRQICWQRRLSFVALGLALGMLWFGCYCLLFLSPAKSLDGEAKAVTATVLDYSYDTGCGSGVLVSLKLKGRTYPCKLYLDTGTELFPGDKVTGEFYLCYTGAEGERASEYHSGTGVFLLGYQRSDIQVDPGDGKSLAHFPARLRRNILQSMEAMFPADTAAFAKALLLGDTSEIDYETDTALTVSGIVHVVSVSGLHISILLSVLFLLLGRRKLLTPALGGAVLVLAAAVTGFSPSVVRSCLMNGLMLLALMLEQEYDPLTALAFALVVMLGFNPLAVTSVGLQLSAASVIGINLFAVPVADWIRARNFWAEARRKGVLYRLREWFASTVGVSISATLTTAPLTALHFGTVSLVGWLTNLLVLWLVNYVFIGIMVCAVLGSFWRLGGSGIAWVLAWGIRAVLGAAKYLARFPLAAVYTESPYVAAWLCFAYAMLGAFLLLRRRHPYQLCLCTLATLVAAVAFSWLDDYRVTVMDVGQGQCVLLHSDGRVYMVDCGGSHDETAADKAAATLHSQGIFHLDGLILTHYDRDHVGAAQYLLTRVPADIVYLPDGPDREQWEPAIRALSGQVLTVTENTALCWGETALRLYPFGDVGTSNESSMCVLFQKENCDILITGDQSQLGEMALLSQNPIPRLDVLVVGHHGSDSSTGEFLLERTAPAVAVISVGEGNAYGHPADRVLERLKRFGCEIRRTDLEGSIIIKG